MAGFALNPDYQPGIVPRPQLGRISWDSSAEAEEMGRETALWGVLSVGGSTAREIQCFHPLWVTWMGVMGC